MILSFEVNLYWVTINLIGLLKELLNKAQSTKRVRPCVCVCEIESIWSKTRVLNQAQHKIYLSHVSAGINKTVLCFVGSLTNSLLKPPEEKSRYGKRGPEESVFYSAEKWTTSGINVGIPPAGQGTGWKTNLIKLTNKPTYLAHQQTDNESN